MRVGVLGELEILLGSGDRPELGGSKPRTLLGVLIAAEGRPVHVARLIDQVWGDEPPDRVEASLQTYVARLRRAFGGGAGDAQRLRTHAGGYSLDVGADEVDARRFAASVRRARADLETDPAGAGRRLAVALDEWRGDPYSGLRTPVLEAEATRLEELRLVALESLWEARLRTGGHADAVADLGHLVGLHPLREQLWGLLALAQYRSARQGEALDTLRRAREHLAEELGIDPGPQLRDLETAMLRQDPDLLAVSAVSAASSIATVTDAHSSPTPAGDSAPPTMDERDGTGPDERARPGVVGREDDLAVADRALDETLSGHGGVVLVTGEPGIGKTRLADEIAARAEARGLRIGRGGWEAEPGPVLLPWRTAVRGLVENDDVLDIPAEVRDAASESHRLADALAEALRGGGPSVIILDDLHWADVDSLRLTRRIASLLPTLPVLLVLASRPPAPDAPPALTDLFAALARTGAVRRQLRGLGPAAIADYVRERAGVEIAATVAEALATRTEGNPFFVTEVVRLLTSEGALSDPESEAWRLVPEVVGDVVRQRLDALPSTAREVLGAAAVLGRTFPAHLLAREELGVAAGSSDRPDDPQDVVDGAMEAGLVLGLVEPAGPGHFRFSHAVVRDAVYQSVPAPARARLHATAAALLERLYAGQWDARSAELAEHYRLAGPTHARAGWGYALRSARQASARSAHAEALRWLGVAAELQGHDLLVTTAEREQVLVPQARALSMLGRSRDVWPVLAEAARSAIERGDAVRAAEILLTANDGAIWGWRQLGETDVAAIALWQEVRDHLGEQAPLLRAQVDLALECEQMHRLDRMADSRPSSEIDLVEVSLSEVRAGHRTHRELIDALFLASLALMRPDQLARRSAAIDELVELCVRRGEDVRLTRALTSRVAVRAELGQWDEARSDLDRATELALRHHVVQELFICQTARAWFLVVDGDLDGARQLIAATAATQDTLSTPGIGVDVGQQAFLAQAEGRPAEAAALVEPLVAFVPGLFRDLHHLLLAEAGELEVVRRRVGAWREQPPLSWDYMWTSVATFRAQLWLRLGDRTAIGDLRRQLEPYAVRLANFGVTAFFSGTVGHTVGELALAEGDDEAGRAHLASARATYARLGLDEWVARVDAKLTPSDPPGPP